MAACMNTNIQLIKNVQKQMYMLVNNINANLKLFVQKLHIFDTFVA